MKAAPNPMTAPAPISASISRFSPTPGGRGSLGGLPPPGFCFPGFLAAGILATGIPAAGTFG